MAWSRISSKVMADPPPLPEACRGRFRDGRAFCHPYIAQMAGKGKREVQRTHGAGARDHTWGAYRRRTAHQGPPLRVGRTHPPCGEISNFSNFSRGSPCSTHKPETATAPLTWRAAVCKTEIAAMPQVCLLFTTAYRGHSPQRAQALPVTLMRPTMPSPLAGPPCQNPR